MKNVTPGSKVPWRTAVKNRVGLIDADGALFAAARAGVTFCDGEQLQMLDDEFIFQDALSRINEQVAWLGECPTVFICLSDRKNFRYSILPTYKGKRNADDRPVTLDELRRRFLEDVMPVGWKVVLIKGLEADDVCGIVSTSFQARGYEACIVSPDKDLLTIPGMVLTPKPGKKVVFSEVPRERADRFHAYQTLVGDTVDHYKGCPGYGPAKADKLLDAHEGDLEGMWEAVVAAFEAKGLTADDALVQARVARILRIEDWDEEAKEPLLWNFPHE